MDAPPAELYRWALEDLRRNARRRTGPRDVRVRFHPYAGLRSTVFDRRDHYEFRVSDAFRGAPAAVHYGLACLLLGRIDRRLVPRRDAVEPYRAWTRSAEGARADEALRRARGRKHMLPPKGEVHDLRDLFHRLNREYFAGTIPPLRIGWSPGRSRRLFGHHDAAHEAIVLNRMLDHPRVPRYVVASVLHHEMLHEKYGVRHRGTRRVVHPPDLRREERAFPAYRAAKRFLDAVAARKIRL